MQRLDVPVGLRAAGVDARMTRSEACDRCGDTPQTLTFAAQHPGDIGADEAGADNGSQAPRVRPIGSRPFVLARKPIHAYADSELVALVGWIESDDLLRTEDELIDEMMRELGFRRHGKNVVATIAAVIARARR